MTCRKQSALLLASLGAIIASPTFARYGPPLTSVTIIEIESSRGGVEVIGADTAITNANHGGETVRMTVREIGYASSLRAITLDGIAVPDTPVSVTPLCGEPASPRACKRGEGQIGYIRVYEIGGVESGRFSYIARDASPSFQYFSDDLQIR